MIKKIGLILCFFCYVSFLFGQINPHGIPDITNYPPESTNGSEINWAVVQDHRGVIYVGNDDKGILEFDGAVWRSIPVPNNRCVRSLACANDGTIYVGADSELGYLVPNEYGLIQYKSLLPRLDSVERIGDIWKTYCLEDKVYYYSEKYTFIYYPALDSINYLLTEQHTLFGFYYNNNFYSGNFPNGLMVLQGDSITVPARGGDYYKEKNIFGLTAYDSENLLIGVNYEYIQKSELSLYNMRTGEIDPFFAEDALNDFLTNNYLYNLIKLNNGNFVASTNTGGIAYFNREGKLLENVGNEEGLQSQSIYDIDQSMEDYPYPPVWTAMSYGLARINLESPFRKFNEEFGYKGLIHTINVLGKRMFIGTSSGLYASTLINNKIKFVKIKNITRQVWDLERIKISQEEEVLIAIGENGLMEVHENGNWNNLLQSISGVKDEKEKVFWGFTIYSDPIQKNRIFLGMESSLTSLKLNKGNWEQEFAIDSISSEVRSFAINDKNKLWFSAKIEGIASLSPISQDGDIVYYDTTRGLPTKENNYLFKVDKDVLVGTTDGIYRIFDNKDTTYFYQDTVLNKYLQKGKNSIIKIYQDPAETIWISYENESSGWNITRLDPINGTEYKPSTKPFYILEDFSTDAFYSSSEDDIWFSLSNILYHYNKNINFKQGEYKALIRKVTINEDSVIFNGAYPKADRNGSFRLSEEQDETMIPKIKYSYNNIEFRWSAPYYDRSDELKFSFFLDGFSKDWSEWESVYYQDFTRLPLGNYTFKIKAKNVYQDVSLVDSFSFEILRPWYLSLVAILLYLIAVVLIVYIIIVLYTRRLKNENIRLEGIIQERTAEIRKQKEELTDSIEYASRIQRALLPPAQLLKKQNLDHFILFRPRDIVSGDFYWFGINKGKIFIVAADCTGHGVPGAFMSMLGISFLDEIVIKSGLSETNQILDALRNHVITSLRQSGAGSMDELTKDGMDLAMVAIDQKTGSVQFSGAYNPLYVVRKLSEKEKSLIAEKKELDIDRGSLVNDTHLLYQVKADLMPIGISEKDHLFSANTIEESEATIYLFSDGFVDQFGGPAGKKFMSKNFKKLILDIQHLSMKDQQKKLENILINWMGNISQIDDILVIGIKLETLINRKRN